MAKLGIQFVVWDKSYLTTHLKRFYTLVATYFNQNIADEHCFGRANLETFESLGTSYIPRRVYPIDTRRGDPYSRWRLKKDDTLSITEILNSDRLKTKRICVIGDPYQGKTYMLRETAYELTTLNMQFTPIWLSMKSYSVQPIEHLLDIKIGAWKNTPSADIVLFLDGLDEVATDRFAEAMQQINAFTTRYPFVTIIFSCRKLYYHHYRLEIELPQFETYELYDLGEQDVTAFLKKSLSTGHEKFITEVDKLGLKSMLYDPFYLSQFIYAFSNPPYKIPSSRLEAVDGFIKKSIEQSELRKLSAGASFHEKVHSYKICIEKFAFALQAMGLNALAENTMQQLFDADEWELLKHSALVTEMNRQWSFTSALFQEFLAARVLMAMEPDDVIPLVTVGKDIRKIKQKWLQTYFTLLGFSTAGSKQEHIYLKVLNEDSIELIFLQTERAKYTEEFRLAALKKLITKCAQKNIRPMVVYEDNIGEFIGQDIRSIKFLIRTMKSGTHNVQTKITCCRILEHCTLNKDIIRTLTQVLLQESGQTTDANYATCCIELLNACKYFDTGFINTATQHSEFNQHYRYRQALYRLIDAAGKTDDFYQYGIDGFPVLIQHNAGIIHTGSESSIITFLTAARMPENLKALYKLCGSDEWTKYFQHDSSGKQHFLKRLGDQTTDVFEKYPAIILTVIDYIRTLNLRSMGDEFPDLDNLFERTNTHTIVTVALYKEILGQDGWQYGCLLSEKTLDYLLFEFEEGGYPVSALIAPLIALQRKPSKRDVYERLEKIVREMQSSEPPSPDAIHWQQLNEFEEQKRQNDIRYMQSKEAFVEAIKQMFEAHGKKPIGEDELYVEYEDRSSVRKSVTSNLIYSFLINWSYAARLWRRDRFCQAAFVANLKSCFLMS